MKIIFLDVDGVFNSHKRGGEEQERVEPRMHGIVGELLANFAGIFDHVGDDIAIVISSTWRRYPEYKNFLIKRLSEHGLDERVIGVTPVSFGSRRGLEILEWLEQHEPLDIDGFAIIDDDSDMEPLMDHFVHIDMKTGFTKEDVQRVLDTLEKPYKPNNEH